MFNIGDIVTYNKNPVYCGFIVDIDNKEYGVVWFNEASNPTNGCYYYSRSDIKKVKSNV